MSFHKKETEKIVLVARPDTRQDMHCIIGCLVDKDKDRGSCYRGFGFIVRELLFEEEELEEGFLGK